LITKKEREREREKEKDIYFIVYKVIFYFIQIYLSIMSTMTVSFKILIKTKRKICAHQ